MIERLESGAPLILNYGTDDQTQRQQEPEPISIPQHLPKWYIYAKKGKPVPVLCNGVARNNYFGADTFNYRKKFATHATVFSDEVNAEGNMGIYERVIPLDAGPEANFTLWFELDETTVDDYQRDNDGLIVLSPVVTNVGGVDVTTYQPTIVGAPINGNKVRVFVTSFSTKAALDNSTTGFGKESVITLSPTKKQYPILSGKYNSQCEAGNLSGISLYSPIAADGMPTKMMEQHRAYPYILSVLSKDNALNVAKIVKTLTGEQSIEFTFKPDTVNPLDDSDMHFDDVYYSAYQNVEDRRYPIIFADFDQIHIYQQNIETVLTQLHAAETAFYDGQVDPVVKATMYGQVDFTADVNDIHLFNFIGGKSSKNVPYHTMVFVDSPSSVRLIKETVLFGKNGSDGTLFDVNADGTRDYAKYDALVSARLDEYIDASSRVMDIAVNPESIIYDSGFGLDTKYKIANLIALRKDTFSVLSLHIHGEGKLSESQEISRATSLLAYVRQFPDSEYFGTDVFRAAIVGRSCKLRNSKWKHRLPLSVEWAIKFARYMGAANGRWKNGANFAGYPGNLLERAIDVSIDWVPSVTRNKLWSLGVNWIQNFDLQTQQIPAFKTVAQDETSYLNGMLLALAICQVNKITFRTWLEHVGTEGKTNAQFVDDVNDTFNRKVKDIFDGKVICVPQTTITERDGIAGNRWTLPVDVYGFGQKNAMTTYVRARRADDLNLTA